MATAKKIKAVTQAQRIRNYAAKNPKASTTAVAQVLELPYQAVYQVLKVRDATPKTPKTPKKTPWKKAVAVLEGIARLEAANRLADAQHITMEEPKADNVNHPAHYKVGGIETIDFIEAKNLNYRLGNVVKYISRADHKGERLENLKKGLWYLEREIAAMSK